MIIQKIQQRFDEELLARKYLDYSRRLLRKLEKQLRELEKEAAEAGKWLPSQIHEANRIDGYIKQMQQEVIQYNEMLNLRLESDLVSTYISEYQWTQRFLREIAQPRATYTFNRVSTGAVKKLLSGMTITDSKGRARTLRDYLTGYSRDLAGQSEKIILDSIALGDSVDNTVADLRKLHTTVSKTRLENTVRTWAVKAHTDANLDVYQKADIKRVQWCAALDMRTCATCAAKDGKIYNLSQIKKTPPIHPRCRCCLLPIVDSNDMFDSSKDGYRAWLVDDLRTPEDLKKLRNRVINQKGISQKEKQEMLGIIDANLESKGVPVASLKQLKTPVKAPRVKQAMKYIPDTFRPATTIAEATDWAKEVNLADIIDWAGTDVEVANQFHEAIFDSLRKFPELRKDFKFIGSAQLQNELIRESLKKSYADLPPKELEEKMAMYERYLHIPKDTYARTYAKGIGVNDVYGLNYEKFTADVVMDMVTKWHPKGCKTIRSVADHEIGHFVDDLLSVSKDKRIQDLYKSYSQQQLTNELSMYSGHNVREFVAEAWAEVLNTPDPRPLSLQVYNVIIELAKKKGVGRL